MVEAEADGSKQLIFSILKQAIVDAKLYRNPQNVKINYPPNRIMRNKILLRNAFIFSVKYGHLYDKSQLFYSISLLKMLDKIFRYNEREPKSNRTKCIEARRFFNDKNPTFCLYMELINHNPEDVAASINREISLFDNGRKNKLCFKRKALTA